MAGITLKTAQRHLGAWLEAELAVTNAQSYTIGSRIMTKADLEEIRKTINCWNKKCLICRQANEAVSLRTTKPFPNNSEI